MAKSPFPGMDPYLERDWLDVHSSLVTYIRDQIQGQLPRDLCARMESRVLLEDTFGDQQAIRYPDVRVVESSRHTGGGVAVLDPPQSLAAQPDLQVRIIPTEPARQRYVEIVDAQTRRKVITVIELVSPSNKRPGPARTTYLEKRDECRAGGVNLVEIDLTRSGDRLSILPALAGIAPPPTYAACVQRVGGGNVIDVYLFPLDRPLKPVSIPLRGQDQDVVVNLQPLVEAAYDRGRYDTLDYRQPLDPPLVGAEAEFAKQALQAAGVDAR